MKYKILIASSSEELESLVNQAKAKDQNLKLAGGVSVVSKLTGGLMFFQAVYPSMWDKKMVK